VSSPDQQHLIFVGKQIEERRGECPRMTDQQHLIFAGRQLKEEGECPCMTTCPLLTNSISYLLESSSRRGGRSVQM